MPSSAAMALLDRLERTRVENSSTEIAEGPVVRVIDLADGMTTPTLIPAMLGGWMLDSSSVACESPA
jgi:hypothetical protein